MFRIAFMVRNNALADTLLGLDGKVMNLEVVPVSDGTKKKRREAGEWLSELGHTFRFRDARKALGTGVSSYLARAIKDKQIKKVKPGVYAKISGKD